MINDNDYLEIPEFLRNQPDDEVIKEEPKEEPVKITFYLDRFKRDMQERAYQIVKESNRVGKNKLLWQLHKEMKEKYADVYEVKQSIVSACIKRLIFNRVFNKIKNGKLQIGELPHLRGYITKVSIDKY